MTPQMWCDIFRMHDAPLDSQGGVACRCRAAVPSRLGAYACSSCRAVVTGDDAGAGAGFAAAATEPFGRPRRPRSRLRFDTSDATAAAPGSRAMPFAIE